MFQSKIVLKKNNPSLFNLKRINNKLKLPGIRLEENKKHYINVEKLGIN